VLFHIFRGSIFFNHHSSIESHLHCQIAVDYKNCADTPHISTTLRLQADTHKHINTFLGILKAFFEVINEDDLDFQDRHHKPPGHSSKSIFKNHSLGKHAKNTTCAVNCADDNSTPACR